MKKLLALLLLVGAGLTAAAYWASPAKTDFPIDQFDWQDVHHGTLTEWTSVTGQLQLQDVVAVGSEMNGQVLKLFPKADFNREVKEGDLLLQLDDRLAQHKLKQAEAAIKLAQANVQLAEVHLANAKKTKDMVKEFKELDLSQRRESILAQAQFQGAEEAVKVAKQKVEEAETARDLAKDVVEMHRIKAPASGTIIDKKVVLGQLIAPPVSAQLFLIAPNLKQMEVNAQVAESDIAKVQKGAAATFTINASSDRHEEFSGKVKEIRPIPITGQTAVFYNTIIEVENRRHGDGQNGDWLLRPGMTGTVEIFDRQHENTWILPTVALNFQLDEHFMTEAAKARWKHWDGGKGKPGQELVWIKDPAGKPWPVFVQTGRLSAQDPLPIKEGRLKDAGPKKDDDEAKFTEILDWDMGMNLAKPDPKDRSTYPKVLTGAPAPPIKPGLLDSVRIKMS